MPNPALIDLPPSLRTPRLLFRKIEDADAEQFHQAAVESFEGLHKWYGGAVAQPGVTLDQVRASIQECLATFDQHSFIQYGAFDAATGKFVGVGNFHHLDWTVPKGRIGYWIRKSEEGKGYATEIANVLTRYAFDRLALKRLEIRASTDNKGSAAIAKKLGYQFLTVFEKNKVGANGALWDLEIHVRFDTASLPPLSIQWGSS
jgi:RimJ/RimL family protein N-acetyltransferase